MSAETIEFLKTVPLFQHLDKRHQSVIAKTVFERSFQPGEVIVKQGEQGLGVYMIEAGKVEVVAEHDGREESLATLGKGEVFGELSLLTDAPRTATVRALEPTKCLVLTAWNFRAEVQQSAELANALLKVVAARLVAVDKQLAAR